MVRSQEKDSAERGGSATTSAARSDEGSQADGGTPDESPSEQEDHPDVKTKVGKGLESIGDLTADALQRIASAVGGVANAPVVIMANVGGLRSNTNSPTSSRGTPLVERVGRLEAQMAMLEEKYNSKTLATELNLSPLSHPTTPRSMEKLRTARSLLQETETKGTLVERVQILEDRLADHMERYDKDLSSIQSKLAHIDAGKLKPESLAVEDADEISPSGEEFHDADQGSGNLESLEPLEQNSSEEADLDSDVHGEASLTQQETLAKKPLAAAPTAEPAAEDGADKSGAMIPSTEPQLALSPEEPHNALAKEPSAAAPSIQFSESARKDAAEKSGIAVAAAEDSSLTSVVDKPQETFVKEPATAASTIEPPEPAQGDETRKSPPVLSSSEPQLATSLGEPQGAPAKEPSIAEASAKLEGPAAQESAADKTVSVPAVAESPLTSVVKEPQNDTVGAVTEDKHVQREYKYKAAEDVKVPDEKPGSFTNFIFEPKPSGRREKEKKGKKEKRQDGLAEENEKKYSLRAEEGSKQPFKHLRDRFRRAFRSKKDS